MTNQASPQVPRPEPKFALLVMCVECGEGVEAPLPIDHKTIALLLAQRGWFMSVLSPPGQGPEVPILGAALCTACAPSVYSPAVMKIVELRRQEMLQAAQDQGAR